MSNAANKTRSANLPKGSPLLRPTWNKAQIAKVREAHLRNGAQAAPPPALPAAEPSAALVRLAAKLREQHRALVESINAATPGEE